MAKRYSQEFKDHAARMVVDPFADEGACSQWQTVAEVVPKLGIGGHRDCILSRRIGS